MKHSSHFQEPSRELPLLDKSDVLVLGGGPGGVGAAISAARNGARTILVERFGCLGGMWTTGILGIVMPFPFVKGIFAEIAEQMTNESAWRSWGACYGAHAVYETEVAKLVLDRMVTEAGVIPYYFTQAVSVLREETQIRGVVIEGKEGRQVIEAKHFIDASGDGDVAVLAGASFEMGRPQDGACQPMTMIFTMDGVDDKRAEAYRGGDADCKNAWNRAKLAGDVTVPREDVLMFNMPRKGEWCFNTSRIIGKDATKLRDVTEAMIEGRLQAREIAEFARKYLPGFENAVLSETAPHVGVRESRRIQCDYIVTADDIIKATEFEDCVARGNWFIDIHSPTGEGTERIYPPEGQSYGIPYRSLRARGLDNLLIASRCLGCTHEALAAIRITPQIVALGQAAGTAAALCVKQGLHSTRSLDCAFLQKTLCNQGAYLPFAQRKKADKHHD